MNSPAQDVKDILEGASSATGLEFGVDLFCFLQPDSPDQCVTIFDTGGYPNQPNYRLEMPTIQVRVRGAPKKYRDAYTIAESVREVLRETHNTSVNGTKYIGFWVMSDIFPLGYDEKNRPEFSINFRLQRTV